MEGKRRSSERIAVRKVTVANQLEKHYDEFNEVDEPIIKRKASNDNHHINVSSDGDKVIQGREKVSNFWFETLASKFTVFEKYFIVFYFPTDFD